LGFDRSFAPWNVHRCTICGIFFTIMTDNYPKFQKSLTPEEYHKLHQDWQKLMMFYPFPITLEDYINTRSKD